MSQKDSVTQRPLTMADIKDKLKSLEDQMFSRLKDKRDIDRIEFESYYHELSYLNREINNALAKFNNVVTPEEEQTKSKKGGGTTKD